MVFFCECPVSDFSPDFRLSSVHLVSVHSALAHHLPVLLAPAVA